MVEMRDQKRIKVFTAFSFLKLRSPDVFSYQWTYPTIILFLFLLVYCGINLWNSELLSFDKESLVADINSLMGKLAGFYIAALAAVSSFRHESLDQKMKGRTPTLYGQGLTRRRFLSILFGYCATVALFLYIAGMLQVHLRVAQPDDVWVQSVLHFCNLAMLALYFWCISSLLVVTLLCLHYLIDRIHRE